MDDRLRSLLKPPARRARAYDSAAWQHLEALFGVALPPDMSEFNAEFGAGFIGPHELGILVPEPSGLLSLVETNMNARLTLELVRQNGDVPADTPIFPEPDGLLAWGESSDGDLWLWETAGPAEQWKVAVLPRDPIWSQNLFRFQRTMSGYLADLFSGVLLDDFSRHVTGGEAPPFDYLPAVFFEMANVGHK